MTIDIDKFKALNNIYGYEFCNTVLKDFGEKLSKVLPYNNVISRIAGDVFATIFSSDKDIIILLNKNSR